MLVSMIYNLPGLDWSSPVDHAELFSGGMAVSIAEIEAHGFTLHEHILPPIIMMITTKGGGNPQTPGINPVLNRLCLKDRSFVEAYVDNHSPNQQCLILLWWFLVWNSLSLAPVRMFGSVGWSPSISLRPGLQRGIHGHHFDKRLCTGIVSDAQREKSWKPHHGSGVQ